MTFHGSVLPCITEVELLVLVLMDHHLTIIVTFTAHR